MIRCLNCMKPFDEKFGVCPSCGFVPGTPPKEAYHLHPGTVLRGRYIVGTTLGFGGFGITYRAWDQTLDKMIAIKEFYPNGIVNRIPGEKEVIIYSGNRADEFQNGKIRFLAEAQNMAKFNTHPNIVNVYDFFEENNTAYIAMEFLDGISYKQYIAANGGRVDSKVAVEVVLSVLDALKEIHKAKIIHRDISPDNIFICSGGVIKLIDFGAARFSTGEEEKTLSIILKPGYAPPEQYRSRSKQGPWTDLYAVGAVLYRSITGIMPEESVNRMVEDHLAAPIELVPDIPQYLNDSILRAMALNQELRFQNVDQFKEAIQNKTKVLSVDGELKRRKTVRGISIAGICLALCGALLVCQQIYVRKENALYAVAADISVLMPDVNGEKLDEIAAVNEIIGASGEDKKFSLESSNEMLGKMLSEYDEKFTNVNLTMKVGADEKGYLDELKQAAERGELPAVFATSQITAADREIWEKLGSLDTTYDTLEEKQYYFLGDKEFQEAFAEKKQIPASFRAPVLYVNTFMVSDTSGLEKITSLEQLSLNQKASYCVSREDFAMYQGAFEGLEEPGVADEKGYEPFLRREKAFYLGSTDDYEAVRASLGGIYKMVVLEDLQKAGKVKGSFTHLWSISGTLNEDEKKAADSMIYYLMGESAQDVFNLQDGNGLSLNKNMLDTYVKGNDEFKEIADHLDSLSMNYGEGQKQ